MVTADQSCNQVVAAVELVPDDYIIKPFSPDRLKLRLDRVLRRKRFMQPLFAAKRVADFEGAERFIEAVRDTADGRLHKFELMRLLADAALLNGDAAHWRHAGHLISVAVAIWLLPAYLPCLLH